MEFYAVSDVGKCRVENQDTCGSVGEDRIFFATVCDGMGGAAAGKQAAEIACAQMTDVFSELFAREHGTHAPKPLTAYESKRLLRLALDRANDAVYLESQKDRSMHGMGTTVAATLFYYGKAYMMHVGDSRIYRYRNGFLERMTSDHSLVQTMVEAGTLTEEQARVHPSRNVITRAVGVGEQISADYRTEELHAGDLYLLCSDGLTGMVDDARIEEILSAPKTVQAKVNALLSAALDAGGEDNVTVFLIECGEDDVYSVWEALTDIRTEDITAAYVSGISNTEIKSGRGDIE